MEMLRKKRKGGESGEESSDRQGGLEYSRRARSEVGSHLSLEACTRMRKKCKEKVVDDEASLVAGTFKSRIAGVVTAPPFGSSLAELSGRGIKRKIGCIEAATRIGRKKKIEQDYVFGDEIGKGRFGSVRLCRSTANGAEFACKTLCKGEETVHREVEIMQHLSGNPGVVTLKSVYEDSDCFHLVMELCPGGRLADQMAKEGRYSERRAACILKELMLVVKYCHEMGVVHRDIKPENILLTSSGSMKLADFGLATRVNNGQSLSGVVGSPAYVAPEVLMGNYSEKVDIWSAGVLLHELVVGVRPFQGDTLEAVFEAIKKVELNFSGGIWESVSAPTQNLIKKMLTRDVSLRVTADEVLRHPWILFHTEQTLKTISIKSKGRNQARALSIQLTSAPSVESERKRVASFSLSDGSGWTAPTHYFGSDLEEQDDCSFVDVLAVAISRVRISEPKRSRLCTGSTPIQEDCSSNVTANNLCTAF